MINESALYCESESFVQESDCTGSVEKQKKVLELVLEQYSCSRLLFIYYSILNELLLLFQFSF